MLPRACALCDADSLAAARVAHHLQQVHIATNGLNASDRTEINQIRVQTRRGESNAPATDGLRIRANRLRLLRRCAIQKALQENLQEIL